MSASKSTSMMRDFTSLPEFDLIKKMKIKTSRLNVRKYTFVVRIVEIWNSLPESVIQAKTVKKFEIGLDEHWKHQECKYDFTAHIQPTCFYLHLLAISPCV
jgi:hypothetical protein